MAVDEPVWASSPAPIFRPDEFSGHLKIQPYDFRLFVERSKRIYYEMPKIIRPNLQKAENFIKPKIRAHKVENSLDQKMNADRWTFTRAAWASSPPVPIFRPYFFF